MVELLESVWSQLSTALHVLFTLMSFLALVFALSVIAAIFRIPLYKKRTHPYMANYARVTSNLKYDETDEEFAYGLRFAKLVMHRTDGSVFLASLKGVPFDSSASRAICIKSQVADHHPPVDGCSCGFYSMRDFTTLVERIPQSKFMTFSLLHVRLSGRIIEGEYGMRAERQDVQTVWLPSSCMHGFFCGKPAISMSSGRKNGILRLVGWDDHNLYVNLIPVCKKHASFYRVQKTVTEITAHLQTEVVWA